MSRIRLPILFSRTALKHALAATALACASVGTQAHAELPPIQNQGGIEYVSGGFGQDESTAFKQAMPQFPLAMTFSSRSDGAAAYAADVQVVIRDENDANVLNVASEGPFLLVKLPPGKYRVFATYDNKTQERQINVEASDSTRLTFAWERPASGPD
ncbi:carboxypeptidase-like regulatory domain-containing protein [Pollutimonas subterranea]|uniref:carboxypeptidase-like regulatory domain-containing protein n=1 Tax=Pollutimonas subterranea TaxID=2045210 RepID=UPI001E513161|nr:carboxypeptidase-like regulatory domain-containing protein [Pollutimonas subterranea]